MSEPRPVLSSRAISVITAFDRASFDVGVTNGRDPYCMGVAAKARRDLEDFVAEIEANSPAARIRAFIRYARQARAIAECGASWQTKYDLIFCDDLSGAVRKLGISFDYYDPDTSYQEDVLAYVRALEEKAGDLEPALKSLEPVT